MDLFPKNILLLSTSLLPDYMSLYQCYFWMKAKASQVKSCLFAYKMRFTMNERIIDIQTQKLMGDGTEAGLLNVSSRLLIAVRAAALGQTFSLKKIGLL